MSFFDSIQATIIKKDYIIFFGRRIFFKGGKICFLSLRGGRISREKDFLIKLTQYYCDQKLTNILEAMTFNVGKNQENYSFFHVF